MFYPGPTLNGTPVHISATVAPWGNKKSVEKFGTEYLKRGLMKKCELSNVKINLGQSG
jgi:hypothetical protein